MKRMAWLLAVVIVASSLGFSAGLRAPVVSIHRHGQSQRRRNAHGSEERLKRGRSTRTRHEGYREGRRQSDGVLHNGRRRD